MEQPQLKSRPDVSRPRHGDDGNVEAEEKPSFQELWGTYGAELYRRCLRWTSGREEEAEEAFSRAGLLAFRKYPSHRRELTDPHRWFVRLTYNVCMDLHRELKRERASQILDSEAVEAAPGPVQSAEFASPERLALRAELERYILRSVRSLSPILREVVESILLGGSSYQEAADRLGVSQVSLRKRVQQARALLRRKLAVYAAGGALKQQLAKRQIEVPIEPHPWSVAAPVQLESLQIRLESGLERDCPMPGEEPRRPPSLRQLERLCTYVARHPTGWKKRLELARVLALSGRFSEAAAQYRAVVQRQPLRVSIWLELAEMLRGLDRENETLQTWKEARRHANTVASSKHVEAWIASQDGDLARARSALAEAARLEPKNEAHPIALGRILLQAGRAAEAAQAFDSALEIQPENAVAGAFKRQAGRACGGSTDVRSRRQWSRPSLHDVRADARLRRVDTDMRCRPS